MRTEVLSCENSKSRAESIKRAAVLLKAGGIVGFPTETVYGLAVVARNEQAEARLRDVRGRAEDKPFSIAIAEGRTVSRFVKRIGPLARRLMSRCWPGPLTIVFETEGGETVGLRLPSNDVAARFPNSSVVACWPETTTRTGVPSNAASESGERFGQDSFRLPPTAW